MKINRNPNSHKGTNGRVLIIGGSEIYTGAPALAGLSALRTGADLVYIAAPTRAADVCASISPDLITIPLAGKTLSSKHVSMIKPWLEKSDVLVIGPGLGTAPETIKAVLSLVESCKKPIVIDADAIKAVATKYSVLQNKNVVLTPHRKEFEILSKSPATEKAVRMFAIDHDVTLLVKAPVDIISNGVTTKLNKNGNPGMTVGGTGDVLSGVVAGLISQGQNLFDAALHGAKIVGLAGDSCYHEQGLGFTASDVVEKIPKAVMDA